MALEDTPIEQLSNVSEGKHATPPIFSQGSLFFAKRSDSTSTHRLIVRLIEEDVVNILDSPRLEQLQTLKSIWSIPWLLAVIISMNNLR